ncbi:histidinol dehydrogenase [Maridesulfovibrio hydrothermalis]|uniref:Histidinol dehydrogenase n=1 Tax=Maridesulfovibrio hydrothermalis AM13 = DSM 14728 TaxID=1121451 RepID=L0RE67_9BACT|nr:histidinol dehydrogenase [Maridesulfovibrio hydrothermalis]CCO24497.1 histidinol dehydrogenase [Maridesulfovibrio hydrothermalis AM13 = DSM 14728]
MPCKDINYSGQSDWPEIKKWLELRINPDRKVDGIVRDILEKVKTEGDQALIDYTQKFDCPDFKAERLKIKADQLSLAYAEVETEDLEIIEEAIRNIRNFHRKQVEESWWTTEEDGTILGQLVRPVDRVGLYVPGGQGGETPLISSMIMNAVPAQVAGVKQIAVISPPRKDGTLNPYILATAQELGITEIYASGSAWAIGALAYGTQTIAPCDVIAGPGNIFVATAKGQLVGEVGIDMIAGPSEIAILADNTANPVWVAADMLSQAEHDPLAASILITWDPELGPKVKEELRIQAALLPRGEIALKSLNDWGAIVTVSDRNTGINFVNNMAPEHLELAFEEPWSSLGQIKHAGAIFMGHHSPEPIGDYFAGPNHVLPTVGTARFSSALSVETFTKKTSLIYTDQNYISRHGGKIARLARLEGLEAHARSVESRLSDS